MIDKTEVLEFISKFGGLSNIDRFRSEIKIDNEPIEINLDDRTKYIIRKDQVGEFFIEYMTKCKFLETIIDIDIDEEISNMCSFINGEIDEVNIYHYSVLPQKMQNNSITIDNYYLINLNDEGFSKFLNSHSSAKSMIDVEKYSPEHVSLIISKERSKRRIVANSFHFDIDRLDEIYSYHSIIRFIIDFYVGDIQHFHSSLSTDNFPNANSSQTSRVIRTEIGKIEAAHTNKIFSIVSFLRDKLFFRLVIRSELSTKSVFEKAIFLRSILDPIFSRNKSVINSAFRPGDKKTNIQAKYVLKTLSDKHGQYVGLISEAELTNFLQIRNSIIHPNL